MKRRIVLLLAFAIVVAVIVSTFTVAGAAEARNIIFIIGDGMGFAQVEAARMYKGSALSFEGLPYQGEITTYSADSSITDSAAAATALATGVKVNNEVISQATPGDGSDLETLLEFYRDKGKATGLVTTTHMTHATPATFGAHESSRDFHDNIASDYLNDSRPNVLFGGGSHGLTTADAIAAGYTVVTDRTSMQALDTGAVTMVSGQFGVEHLPFEVDGMGSLPRLAEMTVTALDILDNDPDGFFLMIEGGRIDHASHYNDIGRAVGEVLGLGDTVSEVLAWVAGRTDTLLVVTADHETGGLTVEKDNGPLSLPDVSWSTGIHTGVNVPVYAWGVNADLVFGTMDNTYMHEIASGMGAPGDANRDGKVDGGDLGFWQRNYAPLGYTASADGSPASLRATVPEPATLALFAATTLALVLSRHRRSLFSTRFRP